MNKQHQVTAFGRFFFSAVFFLGAVAHAAPPHRSTAGKEEVVDLSKLETRVEDKSKAGPSQKFGGYAPPGARVAPDLKLYFDLWFLSQPGVKPPTFDSFHYFFLVDYVPTPDIQFSTEINTQPRFFQLEYRFSDFWSFRLGRIWVPFDQMNPHNTFGGIMNTSAMRAPKDPALFPDLWTDMGVAMKYRLADGKPVSLEVEVYAVNGFRDGGTDPLAEVTTYPAFDAIPFPDNNANKAFGFRAHFDIRDYIGIGASGYHGAYSKDGAQKITLLGVDGQLRPPGVTNLQLRAGYMFGQIDLPPGASKANFQRAGFYTEASLKLFTRWTLLGRMGITQPDSRVSDSGDKLNVGGGLSYMFQPFQISLMHFKDLNDVGVKVNREFTGLRFVAIL